MLTKTCYSCNIEKNVDDFYAHKLMKDGRLNICKDCQKSRSRKNHDKNREHRNTQRRALYYKDKERHIELCVAYRRNRRASNSLLRLKESIGRSIWRSCNKRGFVKNCVARKAIGCEWDFFKSHIESMFTDGMSWDNYGKWHIDHIMPLKTAITEDDVYRLNHYTNLQPLWAIDNMKKGSKIYEYKK